MARLLRTALILLPFLAPALPAQDWEVFLNGDLAKVKEELKKMPAETGIDTQDEAGSTALTLAAQFNPHPAVVRHLLEAGADPLLSDQDGADALMSAASGQTNLEVFDALLAAGAELEARDYQGWTPLMYAANLQEDSKVLAYLLQKGAQVSALDKEGKSALMIAAAWNPNPTILTHLIKAGASMDTVDEYLGWNSFFWSAAQNPNPDVLQLFLAAGASVDEIDDLDESVLMVAAGFNPSMAMHRFLLEQGADPNYVNEEGITVLMNAASNENPEVGLLYLAQGNNPLAADAYGLTALMIASESQTDARLVEALLGAGAKPSVKDDDGWTALHFAEEGAVVKALLDAGAQVNALTADGATPLMIAVFETEGVFEVGAIRQLLGAGAALEVQDSLGNTALHIAVSCGHIQAVRLLLDAGADPTALTKNGSSVLEMVGRYDDTNDAEMTALLTAALAQAAKAKQGE